MPRCYSSLQSIKKNPSFFQKKFYFVINCEAFMKTRTLLLSALLAATTAFAAKPLSIWIMPNGASPKEKLESELAKFTAETGIKAEVTVLDWGEAWGRISNALNGDKDLPAVVQLGTTWIPYFASRGTILNLDPYMKDIKAERFLPVSFGTTHIEGDPKIYSVPWFVDARTLIGNKSVLEKLGITAKDVETYEGFTNVLKKVKEANLTREDGTPIEPYAFPGKSDWNIPHNFAPWVWSEGGHFVRTEDGKTHSAILEQNTLRGIAQYLKFVKDSLVAREHLQKNTVEITQLFCDGQLAFILNTTELAMQIRIPNAEGGLMYSQIGKDGLQIFPVPKGSAGSVGFIGGSNLAIPAKYENRDDALKLLKFLTSDASLDAYTKHIGFLPPAEDVLKDWAKDSIYTPLLECMKNGHAYPSLPLWGEVERILVSMFSEIWSLLEFEGLYTDEKVYEILARNDVALNSLLGNGNATASLNFEEFQKIWDPVYFSKVNLPKQNADENKVEENKTVSSTPITYTIALLVLAIIAGFVFTYRRKK